MKIIKTKLSTFEVNCECPQCKVGNLEYSYHDELNENNNKIHLHICNKCKEWTPLDKKYPYKEYFTEKEEREIFNNSKI